MVWPRYDVDDFFIPHSGCPVPGSDKSIVVGTRGVPGAHAPPSFQFVPYISCTTNEILHTVPPQSKSLSYTSEEDERNEGVGVASANLKTCPWYQDEMER